MKKDDLYRSQFRLPYGLYEQLKEAADGNKNSVNAELVSRLQETFSIEQAIAEIAPGAPLTGTADLLRDFERELDAARDELQQLNLEAHANALNDQLSHNNAMLEKIESRIEYLIVLSKHKP